MRTRTITNAILCHLRKYYIKERLNGDLTVKRPLWQDDYTILVTDCKHRIHYSIKLLRSVVMIDRYTLQTSVRKSWPVADPKLFDGLTGLITEALGND